METESNIHRGNTVRVCAKAEINPDDRITDPHLTLHVIDEIIGDFSIDIDGSFTHVTLPARDLELNIPRSRSDHFDDAIAGDMHVHHTAVGNTCKKTCTITTHEESEEQITELTNGTVPD